MKRVRAIASSVILTAILAATGVACGSAGPLPPPPKSPAPVPWPAPLVSSESAAGTPDAPFRERMPEPSGAVVFVPPKIESFALQNGIRVLFTSRTDLPVVSVRVVARSGAGDLAGERPGAMAFMGAMLEQGTTTKSALAISDAYEAIGALHDAGVGWDSGQATLKVLSTQLDAALDLLADVTIHPAFPQAEIDRLKARWLAGIQAEKTSPNAMASNAVAAVLYGRAHPYGHSTGGNESDAKGITRDDVVHAYSATFTPSNVTIVVAGDVTRDALMPKLEARFGGWKAAVARSNRSAARAEPKGGAARLIVVEKAGAPQSQVVVCEPGAPFATPDREALSVMNTILGGMFSSRMNLNLREARALTYGVSSRFSLRHGAGPFTAGGAVTAAKTSIAIEELLKEISAIRDKEVTSEELADAKEHIKLAMPGRFEAVTDVTGALADLAIYDLPLDEYATRPARIEAVSAADVKRAAQAHLHPAKLKVVIVGDRAVIDETLPSLNLGLPELRDAYGDKPPLSH